MLSKISKAAKRQISARELNGPQDSAKSRSSVEDSTWEGIVHHLAPLSEECQLAARRAASVDCHTCPPDTMKGPMYFPYWWAPGLPDIASCQLVRRCAGYLLPFPNQTSLRSERHETLHPTSAICPPHHAIWIIKRKFNILSTFIMYSARNFKYASRNRIQLQDVFFVFWKLSNIKSSPASNIGYLFPPPLILLYE